MSKEKVLSAGESLSEAFTGSPGLCLLFTLYWVWSNVTFQSTFFFPSLMVIGGHSVASWAIPVLFAAGTLVVLALRCRFHQQDEGRVLVTAGSILSFMGAVVLAARSLTNPADVSNLTVLVIVLGGAMVGKTVRALVEGPGREEGTLTARLDNNMTVDFAGGAPVGEFADVRVTGVRGAMLKGELA